MGEAAYDIINGLSCNRCGVYFKEKHGSPVICKGCWTDLPEDEKTDHSVAVYDEL